MDVATTGHGKPNGRGTSAQEPLGDATVAEARVQTHADAPAATDRPPPAATRDTSAAQAEPPANRVASLAGLTRIAGAYLGEDELQRIRDAYRFSDEAHLGQFRSSGEPYISHPIAVAEICAGWRLDTESLMAALLHDVVEDSGTTREALHERFGPSVAELVDGLSKLDRLHFASREQAQAESFRKMLLAMARDVRVILIKLADRLHNMQTLSAVEPGKQRRVANETLDIYAPIAYRLGLNELYHELEDLSFKARSPYRYRTLRKAVQAARGNRREAVSKVLELVQRRLPQFGVHAELYGREKSLFGIYRKMAEKRISFSQVLDLFGFRIIAPD
ncbi:MAG: HD domain-containing protein, partial [Burkholderiales bacterium]